MNEILENPVLEFNPKQMVKVRELYNYNDLNRLNQDVKILEDWIKKQNHFIVKEYDKEYLERFIINCKGSVERAKKHFDKLCTLRGLMPTYLQGYDVKNEFKDLFKTFDMCVLPKPTPDNYRVIFISLFNPDAHETFNLLHFTRYLIVLLEYLSSHDYSVGVEIIGDTRKFNLNIISKLNPVIVANTVLLALEARGLRLKGIHLLTGSKFVDMVVAIVKQGLTKKLTPRLRVHDNVESLYEFVPREILPKEYGGDGASLKEISGNVYKEVSSDEHIKRMKFIESAATDESKRLSSTFNEEYSGMPGSFKVLTVD